jgi:hypothetical protein
MAHQIKSAFRSGMIAACFVSTDVLITACSVAYSIESLISHRSVFDVTRGAALAAAGVGLGLRSLRHWQKKNDQQSAPSNG